MFAAAGAPILQQQVSRAIQREPSTLLLSTEMLLDVISSVFRDHMREPLGQGLVLVGGNRTAEEQGPRIVLIDIHGALHDVQSPWWAIGSGYQAALGFLRGCTLGLREAISPDDGERAIACAAELTANVGDGVQVERL